jgi:hypothetical protein
MKKKLSTVLFQILRVFIQVNDMRIRKKLKGKKERTKESKYALYDD